MYGSSAKTRWAVRSADGIVTSAVSGRSPRAKARTARQLKERLKPYVVAPEVTVVIEQSRVNVAPIGEVKGWAWAELGHRPARCQGRRMTEFADTDSIYVLRPIGGSKTRRIRFTYKQLVDAEPAAIGFYLKSGDVVCRVIRHLNTWRASARSACGRCRDLEAVSIAWLRLFRPMRERHYSDLA
jgi:hypothetical protein